MNMSGDITDDRLLVERILDSEPGAFEAFIGRYQKLVAHVVFRMIANRADREDVCQEVFLAAYRHLARFKFECKLSTWLGRIAYNKSLHYLEKKKLPLYEDMVEESNTGKIAVDESPSPLDMAETGNLAGLLRREIDRLPPHYRAVVALYHLDQMSYEEIGEITGLPEGTVKSHLYRARKLLKEHLTERYALEEIWD